MFSRTSRTKIQCILSALSLVGGTLSAQSALPESYDLRDIDGRSYIGPVHYQGNAGTCYAFASCGVAEAAYNRANDLHDENCADFSESFIAWSMDPYYDGIDGTYGGATTHDDLQSLLDYGVCSEADFPYTDTPPTDGNFHMDAPRVKFASWHYLPAYDVETMKRAMLRAGAIQVGLFVDPDGGFYADDYHGAVYSDDTVATTSLMECDSFMNHSVALVGWDDATGSWIVRNSWDTKWGENGYGRITYYTMGAATNATYLLYDDWTGEDFADVNDGEVSAEGALADGTTRACGYYRWGGVSASLSNSGDIMASAVDSSGNNAFAYGAFLWAGENAVMDNSGRVYSGAEAAGSKLSTAYGACLQGGEMSNTGTIAAFANNPDSGRASAYGASFYAFERGEGSFVNSGIIRAEASGGDAWATGAHVVFAKSTVNSGLIRADADTTAGGLVVLQCDLVQNFGTIRANSLRDATGVYAELCESVVNESGGLVEALADGGTAIGVYSSDGNAENFGTIRAVSEDGDACGVELEDGGSFFNHAGALVEAVSRGGLAKGISSDGCNVRNDGTISGDTSFIESGKISGRGLFDSDLECKDAVVSPGTGVGDVQTLAVTGNFKSTGTFEMHADVRADSSDILAVGGRASIEGDASLTILTHGYVGSGDYLFISSDGAGGTFSTVDTPLMYRGGVSAGDDGFTLELVRRSYSEFSTTAATLPMTLAMDSARPIASGALSSMLEGIDDSSEDAEVQSAVSDLFPKMNSLATSAALSGIRRSASLLRGRFLDALDARSRGGWIQGISSDGRLEADGIYPGCDDRLHGIMAGIDFLRGARWTIGGAASSTTQSAVADAAGSASVRARSGSLYALWDARSSGRGGWVSSSISGGSARIDSRRSVEFLDATLSSRHGAESFGVSTGAGWDFLWKGFSLRPFAGLDYALLREKAYVENGGSGAALSFIKNDTRALSADVGASVHTSLALGDFRFIPELKGYRTSELLNDAGNATASFAAGDAFAVPGRGAMGDGWTGEASLRIVYAERLTLGATFAKTNRRDGSAESAVFWVRSVF